MNLEAFRGKVLQDTTALLEVFKEAGFSDVDEIILIIDMKVREIIETRKTGAKDASPGCSVCGHATKVFPVNNSPSTMIGFGYSSCVMCTNKGCMHVDYHKDTVREFLGRVNT